MPTEADLVAAILAEPDDEAGYLVYGDFLQQRGDPRGELIALQHAAGQAARFDPSSDEGSRRSDPSSDEGSAAVAHHLAKHRVALLGRLAPHEPTAITVDWHLGFVRRARIVVGREEDALAIVEAIAGEIACQFLRRLEVMLDGKRRSYVRIDALLAELARPKALCELELGRAGDHAISAALRAAFPAIDRNVDPWPAVVAAIAKLRIPVSSIDHASLPVLERRTGGPVPVEPASLVAAFSSEISKKKPVGIMEAVSATCSVGARDRFAAGLIAAWARGEQRPYDAWVFDAAAVLGSRVTATAIGRRIPAISYQRAEQAIDALARIDHPQALLELFAASRGHTKRGLYAERVLGVFANAEGKSVGGLLARAGAGKIIDDDVGRRAVELDDLAIEWLMTTGWSARVRAVIPWFVTSPRAKRFGGLVWTRGAQAFRWLDERAVDAGGATVELAPDDVVSIVHPAQLSESERDRWRALVSPPRFDQLDRALPLGRGTAPTLDDLQALVRARGLASTDVLRARGFREGARDFETGVPAAKRYRWTNVVYTIGIDVTRTLAVSHPEMPAVVLHEAARDLCWR